MRPTRLAPSVVLVVSAVLSIAACSSPGGSQEPPGAAATTAPSTTPDDPADAADAPVEPVDDAAGFDAVASCAEVEAVIGTYVAGLVPAEDNGVDDYGAYCTWDTGDDAVALPEIRSVEVIVEDQVDDVPVAADLEAVGLEIVPDADVEAAGGVAYTAGTDTALAGVITTTVELPGVRATFAATQVAGHPALDAPAAVAAGKVLLGLG